MGTAQYLSPEQAQGHAVTRAVGPLLDRHRPLRAAHRAACPFEGDSRGDDRAQAGLRGARAAARAQPGRLARARGRRAARAAEGPGRALRRRRRVHRRARAGARPASARRRRRRRGTYRRAGRGARVEDARPAEAARVALVARGRSRCSCSPRPAVGAYLLLAAGRRWRCPTSSAPRRRPPRRGCSNDGLRGRHRAGAQRHRAERRGHPPAPGPRSSADEGVDGDDHRLRRARPTARCPTSRGSAEREATRRARGRAASRSGAPPRPPTTVAEGDVVIETRPRRRLAGCRSGRTVTLGRLTGPEQVDGAGRRRRHARGGAQRARGGRLQGDRDRARGRPRPSPAPSSPRTPGAGATADAGATVTLTVADEPRARWRCPTSSARRPRRPTRRAARGRVPPAHPARDDGHDRRGRHRGRPEPGRPATERRRGATIT